MQYAIMAINENLNVLIDAVEVSALNDYGQREDEVKVCPLEDDVQQLRVVYGVFMPQPNSEREKIIKQVKESVGYIISHIELEQDSCCIVDMELVDIELYEQYGEGTYNPRGQYIPFAALIRTDHAIPQLKKRAITSFLRYGNMGALTNVLNRFGIFSIRDEERRIKKEVTVEGWKEFIDESRVMKILNTPK
ncbi:hypothetical protein R6231_14585 [Bacillus cytotoxicus]|uniref:hypothetical protein n=1 Tax=Bacillus cereus group TaxID=86661 RepID=UPI000B96D21A|nr:MULTISPECIES: hypothetical protein [Bacillus cereus group]AWC30993.1 hypothetical protein CG483_022505 [Bacillus cytotoxicus]AWC35059.1 hypothetical protein CG482_022640 [Bacillus cytotoxicus]AWC39098.1 hypothetical protein CG481_022645 [Bacillus cytotoxicus]AWC43085.1 hypothetical protein CG480_022340 [Bacillus cytotoxicus]AWC47002.1 hypothetical protein CG479_021610 [Bacillus cytotoxicus]